MHSLPYAQYRVLQKQSVHLLQREVLPFCALLVT